MTSERSITAAIQKYLKSIGAKAVKIHGGPMSHAGTPDILGAYRGTPLALEVKKPGGHLSKIQIHELLEWKKAGAIAGKVESVQDVKNLIEGEPDA